MNKTLAFFILLFVGNFLFAQQRIVFDLHKGKWLEEYTLPKSVTCTFKNGTKQRLVLEKVKGDSLIFRKYYNQQLSYDCLYSSLKKIKVHKKGEEITYTVFFMSLATSVAFLTSAVILGDSVPSDAGDPSHGTAGVLVILTAIPFTGIIISAFNLPKHYEPTEWKLYAK
jgi:hypothetical protein